MEIKTDKKFPILEFQDILGNHVKLAEDFVKEIKPLAFFRDYLRYGYYPYFLEGEKDYAQRLGETILMILEQELPLLKMIEPAYVPKIKQLLAIISQSVPFVPTIGNLRGTFLVNQLSAKHSIRYSEKSDFLVDDIYNYRSGRKEQEQ